MAITSAHGDGRELSENALRLYGACAIRNAEQVEAIKAAHPEAHAELVDWGLIALDQPADTVPAVRDPKGALQRRFDDVLNAAERQVALLKALPELAQQLSHAYDSVQLRIPGTASVYLDDSDVVNARLQDVVGGARREILASQPGGPRDQALLDIAMPRDVAALDRGVVLRTIYRETVRDHGPTAAYAAQMTSRGPGRSAQYRTMPGKFERMIIVDRETAVVPDYIVAESPPHAAWIITDPASVVMLARAFEATWMRAQPWMGQLRARRGDARDTVGSRASALDGVRTTRRQREIMRNLCDGYSQETTAKRIGVSKRTLEDEVASMKERWGVGSMNELIFHYAQSPDCRVDDSASAAGPAGAEYETTA
ncbi:hypothetical protein DMH12_24900 [Streptomyces sp. WAC 04229]|uniref:hypothetical protein n=1 Tax=Streptomyces sp. WAC 04229 TaxID=2203206 RepID=UPI000F736BBC|nr:hypothetical protein [Streptomyces sp. WAC 04229]RSN50524.1 hypothetical protein DMH12_24900 [Streptomyces sp. WAC 04229]